MPPSSTPKFSVVIPTYNRHDLVVRRAVASVLAQTQQHFECLVVADGPDINTFNAIMRLDDARVRYLALPFHMGGWGAPCRAFGAEYAKGEIIAYLDDDNAWRRMHLDMLDAAFTDKTVDFVHTQMQIVVTGQVIGNGEQVVGQVDSSVLAHRPGVLEKYGCWAGADADYTQDGLLVEEWVRRGARGRFVPHITVDYYHDARR